VTAVTAALGMPGPDSSPPVAGGDATVVDLVRPLIGWEGCTRFAVVPLGPRYGPYLALTSLDQPGLRFVVVPPGCLFDDYVVEVPAADRDLLGLDDGADALVLAIVRRRGVETPVVNLMGPIVVNRCTGRATQVVLQDTGYGAAVPVDAGTARPS